MKKVILKIKKRFFKSKSPSKIFMRTNIDAYIDAFEEQKGDSKQINPSHYISESGIEALDVLDAFKPCPEYKAGFFWGNVVKYILRFHKKNGVEDLKKAEFYLKRLIEELDHGS